MSTHKHPVGPQASTVYRRRRLVVGLGVLAVLLIIILIVVRPGGGDPASTATPAPTASAADPAAPAAPADPAAAGSACDPANVQVEAITDQGSYDPGDEPELSLSVTNTGTTACDLNAGTSTQVFTITSGADVYWTSTDCQTEPADATVTLQPGEPVTTKTPLTWDRTRSSPETCEITEREPVPAEGASYYLSVTVDGVESAAPAQFLLN